VRYELLGSLRIVGENGENSLTAPKIETLLAALLIRAEQLTSTSQLVDEIWHSEPPKRAIPALHVYVSQLRKFLSQCGSVGNPVVTKAPGYLLTLSADDETDLYDFRRWMVDGEGRMRLAQYDAAAESFQCALSVWRGPVFGELREGPIIRGFGTWLNELRLECVASMVTCGLQSGRHSELIPFLYSVIAENPLNEIYYQQLMLALYQSGRRAEALKIYHNAREILRAELGLEPCRGLTELQQRVLLAEDPCTGGSVPAPRSWMSSLYETFARST
jgi:DNA-binding SARP family transcriptional activator